jgi:Divergent InlB B-repeat domain/WD40-like Beta Propeller Repeat
MRGRTIQGTRARRAVLTGLLSSCAVAAALLSASAPALASEGPMPFSTPALAPEEHPYLPAHSIVDELKPEASACGVATDSAGDVYVSDYAEKKVLVYSPTATKITEFTPTLSYPCSLAVDSAGAVYVEEYNGKVVKEKPSSFPPTASTTYALEESAGTKGVIVPKTGHARAIAVDPANQHLYVAAETHISSYEPNGKLVSATIGEGLVSGASYYGVDVYGADGDVYVTDIAHAKAYILNPEGTAIVKEITGAGGPEGALTDFIYGLSVDQSSGDFYVYRALGYSSNFGNAIYEFAPSGAYLSEIGPEFDGGSLHLEAFEPDVVTVDNGSSSPNKGDVYVSSRDQAHEADSVYAFGPALPKYPLSLSASGSGSGSLECKLGGGEAEPCAAEYTEGSEVEVVPVPEAGSEFLEWSGDCSGAGTCEVTMSEAKAVEAVFVSLSGKTLSVTRSGNGTVTSDLAGVQGEKIECGTHCAENFNEGELVKLVGTVGPSTEAAQWSGCDAVNGSDECEVTMSAAKAVEAKFTRELSVSQSGPGSLLVRCEVAPSEFKSCATPLSELEYGTHLEVTAQASAGAELESFAGTGSASGCEAQGSPCTFAIAEDSTLSAEFVLPARTLAIQVSGKGAGQVNCQVNGGATDEPCATSYPNGTALKLIPVAAGGSEFAGFDAGTGSAGACAGTAPCEFTIEADSSLNAPFILAGEKTLSIDTTGGTGSGRVDCEVNGGSTDEPCAASYPPGTALKLTPVDGPHSEFAGFDAGTGSAGACAGTAPCEFTLAADSSLEAPFAAILRTLSIAIAGEGEVECEVNGGPAEPCAAQYVEGTELELLARPKTHWAFESWSEGAGSIACTGSGACGPFDLEADSSATASFATVATGPFALPDGRGWEMVSPPEKHGALVEPIGEDWLIQAAADGNALAYVTRTATEAEPAGALIYDSQLADRSPSGGWSSRELALPHAAATGVSIGLGWEYRAFSPDLSRAFVQPFGPFLPCESEAGEPRPCLSPEASEQTAFLASDYAPGTTQPCASDCYTPLVTGAAGHANVPAGTEFGQTNTPFGSSCPPKLYCGPRFLDSTPDAAHALLESHEALTESPAPGHPVPVNSLYEWSAAKPPAEQLRLISVLPGNASGEALPAAGASLGFDSENLRHAISPDGSRVVFGNGHLYLRENATEAQSALNGSGECTEPQKACTIRLDPGLSGGARFQDADAGLSRFFFTESGDFYEYDLATETLTRLTEGAGALRAAIGASEDGDSLYFAAGGNCEGGGEPAEQRCNLYLLHDGAGGWEAPKPIAVLSGADATDWGQNNGAFAELTARVSPNGRYLAFMSSRDLTGYDNRDARSGEPDQEVYLYDAATETLTCASCNPTGARPQGVEANKLNTDYGGIAGGQQVLSGWVAANVPGWTPNLRDASIYQSRYLSNSGRLFFNSSDALAPKDSNGTEDVYEYEPEGVGSCTPASSSGSVVFEPAASAEVEGRTVTGAAGCVGLISSGLSSRESAFLDASESGDDVFFLTAARLSPRDFDTATDVYDARVGGGEAAPSAPSECEGDSCQSVPSAPRFQAPSSAAFQGPGNLREGASPAKRRCAKRKVLRRGKCVAKKAHAKHRKHARHRRRAHRHGRTNR